ncbi:MAG: DUF1186 domain-containing protein [Candidatus Brocadiaceae bacterium]
MSDYATLNDDALVKLLFTEEDRLPREAVDEFLMRSERMIAPLSGIISKESNWAAEIPEFWAPVHAVFILGAIGTKESISPLINAITWSKKYTVDWVYDAFPAIFGKIGIPALEDLRKLAQDKKQDWYVRTNAVQGLAGITACNPERENNLIPFIHSIFMDKEEDMDLRVIAANVLLDFSCNDYKESLLAFCKEERALRETQPFPVVSFDEADVEKIFSGNKKDISYYIRDWLSFYDEKEIRRRQERWKKEYEKQAEDDYEYDEMPKPIMENTPKTGRNDPCPCGSGKKYKKCCMERGNPYLLDKVNT